MKKRICKMNENEMQNIRVQDLQAEGKITVLVIEQGKCASFTLPEHGDTVIVTSRGSGYKVKFNEEHLL